MEPESVWKERWESATLPMARQYMELATQKQSLVCLAADGLLGYVMKFESNGQNEIFFVDGAEHSLAQSHFDAFSSASAHFLEAFSIDNEVDVYVSQRSVLHAIGNIAGVRAWHMPPSFNYCNSGISGVSLLVERALKPTLSGSGAVLMPYLGTSHSLNKTAMSAIPTAEQFYLRMETSDHKDLVCG